MTDLARLFVNNLNVFGSLSFTLVWRSLIRSVAFWMPHGFNQKIIRWQDLQILALFFRICDDWACLTELRFYELIYKPWSFKTNGDNSAVLHNILRFPGCRRLLEHYQLMIFVKFEFTYKNESIGYFLWVITGVIILPIEITWNSKFCVLYPISTWCSKWFFPESLSISQGNIIKLCDFSLPAKKNIVTGLHSFIKQMMLPCHFAFGRGSLDNVSLP